MASQLSCRLACSSLPPSFVCLVMLLCSHIAGGCWENLGEPRDYRNAPRYNELTPQEAAFCSRVHVSPADYLHIKVKVCVAATMAQCVFVVRG